MLHFSCNACLLLIWAHKFGMFKKIYILSKQCYVLIFFFSQTELLVEMMYFGATPGSRGIPGDAGDGR